MDEFKKQIDDVFKGVFPKENMLYVCDTTDILKQIGLKELPIMMTQKHLKTIVNKGNDPYINYHNLGKNIVKKIPKALEKPLQILSSRTKNDSIVVVTDLKDKEDRPIIIAIKRCGHGVINDIDYTANILTSAYGRTNFKKFLKENIKEGNLLYDINKGIIKRSDGKLQLQPTTSNKDIISNKDYNVNNSNMLEHEKYTIKEKEKSYGYYVIEILLY